MLQDAMSMSQAKHHLRISQKPDKESCNLFGLSEDQLNDDKVKKREIRQVCSSCSVSFVRVLCLFFDVIKYFPIRVSF